MSNFNWGSAFGATTPTATSSTPSLSFGGTGTGAATSAAAPVGALFQTPAAGAGTTTVSGEQTKPLTWATRFEDLPPVMQQDLTKIQTRILEEKMRSDEIAQHSFDALPKVKSEVEVATERLNALHNSLQGDMDTVAEIRNNITKELKNAEIAVRYTERLAANVPLISQQNFVLPPQYFRELVGSFEKRMEQYRHVLHEILQLRANEPKSYTPQMLQDILRHQYEAFMAAAARVADLHEANEAAKEHFVALRNQATGGNETVEDLFNKEEKRRQRQKARLMPLATPAASATPAAGAATPGAATPSAGGGLWPSAGATTTGGAASTPFSFNMGSSFTPAAATPSTPATSTTTFPSFAATTPTASTPASLTSSLFGSSHTSSAGGLGFSTAGTALSFPTTPTAAPTASRPSSSGRPGTSRKGKGK
jgi:hypothetical protein